jgi:hypothetical protein
MSLEFQYVFTCEGMGARKKQGQPMVNRLAFFVSEREIGRFSRPQGFAQQRLRESSKTLSTQPHDTDSTAAGGRGDGGNGVRVT